jgi:phage protein D
MAVVSLDRESRSERAFFSPRFLIKIEGVGLPRDIARDVVSVTYKDDVTSIDSFELTLNNWDAARTAHKYVGSETQADLDDATEASRLYKVFEPCDKSASVSMGYADKDELLRLMVVGNFTTLEPSWPSGGPPTLTVRGLNVLHQLRTKQYTEPWPNKSDSQIAEEIARKVDKETGKKRFPLPIVIDAKAKAREPVLDMVSQKNQYDIDFLFQRARERGYVLFVQEQDREVRGSKKRLYFGPSQGQGVPGLRDVTFELVWGRSLVDFKPTLTTANQVRSVTVKGWNRRTKVAIKEKADLDSGDVTCNRDLHRLLKQCDPRDEVVVDEPVFDQRQARRRAVAILEDRLKEIVKASGTTVGLPDLRAGRLVRIGGVGSRFSGTYFVTDTTHTIGDTGYTTKFNARRENDCAGAGR